MAAEKQEGRGGACMRYQMALWGVLLQTAVPHPMLWQVLNVHAKT